MDGAFAAAGADRRPSSDDLRTDGGLLTGGDDDVHPTDLTQFQTDILAILAGGGTDAETQTGLEADYGLAIKRALEGYYGQEVYHGRLYPNLDDLFEKGLVERGSVDKRTNSYALTDAGRDLLRGRIEWLADQAGLDVMEVDHRLANTEPVTKEGDD
ncbi:PadR family transcriptional regulator [Haloplanus litoreus]|uniref:PadR family transcriptional regulator n=1 Tax=Haloplanus litoreus TaxID=767515 RepID=A0ABD5ZT01_9EURY